MSSLMIEGFESAERLVREHSPLLRNASAEDVAGAAVYLASGLSAGVTGAVLNVDAGTSSLAAPSIPRAAPAAAGPR